MCEINYTVMRRVVVDFYKVIGAEYWRENTTFVKAAL